MNDDFEKLIGILSKAGDEVNPNINELLLRTLAFFNTLKASLKDADEEEKKQIMALMKDMHDKLNSEVKKMVKKTGMSEEELLGMVDDPQQFTPAQQEIMSKTQKQVEGAKQALSGKKKPPKKDVSKPKHKRKTKKGPWVKS